jgi:hypothetical protein
MLTEQDKAKLDDKRKRIYDKLQAVQGDNPYVHAIKSINTPDKLDLFIQHVQQQADVSPTLTKLIIGESAYDAILEVELTENFSISTV